jgi:hypothetical protein
MITAKDRVMTLRRYMTLVLLLSPVWCSAAGLHITTAPKHITVMDGGDFVIGEGRWRRISAWPSVNAPTINTVYLACDRARRVCEELMAKVLQPFDDPLGTLQDRSLMVSQITFRVLEWSSTLIVARAEQPAVDIDLRISLADKSAERTRRETEAR